MSLIELVLDDGRIVLAGGAALMPLALALLLWFGAHLRRWAQTRAARRAADFDARYLAEHGLLAGPANPEHFVEAVEASAVHHASITTPAPVPSPATADDRESAEEGKEGEGTASEGEGEVVNSAMQELLNSVFDDEEYTNRFEHLAHELDDIQVADLAGLCDDIAGRLS
ncbi:MAG: hypothetical protein GX573_26485 [Chloroflexi bacterium]|nr:hypothetical protein [Chloroflexota bacterium]